ncbi:MAG: glucoamylase family protein, partial [Cellvibrio sp.]
VSDVYQDLFDEGSFIGKGIYDVDAFEQTLRGRFPENRILSHDLLEGCYTRSGLLSDVQLYEENPTTYAADVSRRERWIRGDWQIASWLFKRVPGYDGKKTLNPLSALSRWKILDNLVRSLAPVCLLTMLIMGWLMTGEIWFWTSAVFFIVFIPALLIGVVDLFRRADEVSFWQHCMAVVQSVERNLAQSVFRISCLPHEAVFSLTAILRSMGRLLFTHRLLLEWNPYAEQSSKGPASFWATYSSMWVGPVIALVTGIALGTMYTAVLLDASPVLLIWALAPAVAWWISQPLHRQPAKLNAEQVVFLRKISRKTWTFFERFVGAEDNWLPPDNFQELPGPVIAHRTSPTNMGMALLANVTAYDFAYIPARVMLDRTENTLATMGRMERYAGHFFNWYETTTLRPLPPRYISSVDSGNLVGHLITLRAALIELEDRPIVAPNIFEGLLDTFRLLADTAAGLPSEVVRASIQSLHTQLEAAASSRLTSLSAIYKYLQPLSFNAVALAAELSNIKDEASATQRAEASIWADALATQVQAVEADLLYLAPWVELAGSLDPNGQYGELDRIPTLSHLANAKNQLLKDLGASVAHSSLSDRLHYTNLLRMVAVGCENANDRMGKSQLLIAQINDFTEIEYEFLFDRNRHLLAIGYNVDDFRRDASFYDLLASEARLATFVGIAQGHLSQESWFNLGRLRTSSGGEPTLVSWSGSMFEYLMPNLVMPSYEGTLLDQTCRGAVARQIAYGHQVSVPWGISESGYNATDAALNYQYHAFGAPGLGLKRGLAEDLVIAPYASALALMFAPEEACINLQKLSSMGLEGRYGFYEALDYTPARLARGQTKAIVRSFMAHHQGMSLLSLSYLLLDQPMQKRFESDPQFQATLLLLQERIPKTSVFHNYVAEHAEGAAFFEAEEHPVYAPMGAHTPYPEVQLLSNGTYHLLVTNSGGGYSRWKDLAVSRWREDTTCDNWGSFIYLRDLASKEYWSASHQPTLKRADTYEAIFSEWRAEFRRRDYDIETYTEIVVSPEDNVELRRVRLTNRSRRQRTI